MKFGALLRSTSNDMPEVECLFNTYKQLKKELKKLPRGAGSAQTQGPIDESSFVGALDEKLSNLNNMFLEREEDAVIRLDCLQQEAVCSGPDPERRRSIHKRLVDFHGEVLLLAHWSVLAYTATVKILKKHHKHTGLLLQAPQLEDLLSQPFCSTEVMTQLACRAEQSIAELGGSAAVTASCISGEGQSALAPQAGQLAVTGAFARRRRPRSSSSSLTASDAPPPAAPASAPGEAAGSTPGADDEAGCAPGGLPSCTEERQRGHAHPPLLPQQQPPQQQPPQQQQQQPVDHADSHDSLQPQLPAPPQDALGARVSPACTRGYCRASIRSRTPTAAVGAAAGQRVGGASTVESSWAACAPAGAGGEGRRRGSDGSEVLGPAPPPPPPRASSRGGVWEEQERPRGVKRRLGEWPEHAEGAHRQRRQQPQGSSGGCSGGATGSGSTGLGSTGSGSTGSGSAGSRGGAVRFCPGSTSLPVSSAAQAPQGLNVLHRTQIALSTWSQLRAGASTPSTVIDCPAFRPHAASHHWGSRQLSAQWEGGAGNDSSSVGGQPVEAADS